MTKNEDIEKDLETVREWLPREAHPAVRDLMKVPGDPSSWIPHAALDRLSSRLTADQERLKELEEALDQALQHLKHNAWSEDPCSDKRFAAVQDLRAVLGRSE